MSLLLASGSAPNLPANGPEDPWEWGADDLADPTPWLESDWGLFGAISAGLPHGIAPEDPWPWDVEDPGADWLEAEWDLFGLLNVSVNFCNGAVLLQHNESGFAAANPLYASLPTNAQVGNVIICGITVRGTSDPGAPTPVDTVGAGTWILAVAPATSTGAEVERTAIWFMYDTTGLSHSAQWTFAGSFKGRGFIQEWAGLAASNPFDASTTASVNYAASGASPVTIGPLSGLVQQNELAILQFGLYETNGTAPDSGLRTPAGWQPQFIDENTLNFDGIVYCYVPNTNGFATPSATFSWTQNGTDAAQALLTTWKLNSPCPLKPDEWDWDSDNQNELDFLEADWDLFDALVPGLVPAQPPEDAWDWSYEETEDESWWTHQDDTGLEQPPNPPQPFVRSWQQAYNGALTRTIAYTCFAGDAVIFFAWGNSGAPTITDSVDAPSLLGSIAATQGGVVVAYGTSNATAGAHVATITRSGGSGNANGIVVVIGGATGSPFSGVFSGTSTSLPETISAGITLQQNEAIIAFCETNTGVGAYTSSTGVRYIPETASSFGIVQFAQVSAQAAPYAGPQSVTFGAGQGPSTGQAIIAVTVLSPQVPGNALEDEWDWGLAEEPEEDSWWTSYDDSATLAPPPAVSSQPPDPEWIDEDPDDDTTWWIDESQIQVNYIAPIGPADAWAWEVDPEPDDESWWIEEDSGQDVEYVAPQAIEDSFDWWTDPEPDDEWWAWLDDTGLEQNSIAQPAVTAEDAWDWAFEELEDEIWWHGYDDSAILAGQAAAPPIPEDAWDWSFEEPEEDTWIGLDDTGLFQNNVFLPLPEDAWDWAFEEIEDEWTWAIDDSATLEPPVFIGIGPDDGWDWEEEPTDELGWSWVEYEQAINPGTTLAYTPEDAWDWAPEDAAEDESWWGGLDDYDVEQPTVPPPIAEDAWDWTPEDAPEDESWWEGLDDYDVEQPFFPPSIPEDAWDWAPDDGDDEAWWLTYEDASSVQYGALLPGVVVEDSWDWAYEETEDESWWQVDDDQVEVEYVAPNPAEDAWNWEEEPEDEWIWAIDDASTVGAIPPALSIAPEDAWDWAYEEVEDEVWWTALDDTSLQNAGVPAAGGPEDPWDWSYEEVEDESWWHLDDGSVPVQNNSVTVVAVPLAEDPRYMGKHRKEPKLKVKWGVEQPKEPQKSPRSAKEPAKPSKLLESLFKRAGIGEKPTGIQLHVPHVAPALGITTEQAAVPASPASPKSQEIGDGYVPRGATAQLAEKARKAAEVAAAERARDEADWLALQKEEADRKAEDERQKRLAFERRRAARLDRLERARSARVQKLRTAVDLVIGSLDDIERRIDLTKGRSDKFAALHKKIARSTEEGDWRAVARRVSALREAEAELLALQADLERINEEILGNARHQAELLRQQNEEAIIFLAMKLFEEDDLE